MVAETTGDDEENVALTAFVVAAVVNVFWFWFRPEKVNP